MPLVYSLQAVVDVCGGHIESKKLDRHAEQYRMVKIIIQCRNYDVRHKISITYKQPFLVHIPFGSEEVGHTSLKVT